MHNQNPDRQAICSDFPAVDITTVKTEDGSGEVMVCINGPFAKAVFVDYPESCLPDHILKDDFNGTERSSSANSIPLKLKAVAHNRLEPHETHTGGVCPSSEESFGTGSDHIQFSLDPAEPRLDGISRYERSMGT